MTKQKWSLGDYVEVKDRLRAFWMDFPDGRIITEVVETHWDAEPAICLIKAEIYTDSSDQRPRAVGWAYEKEVGQVNRTSFIENGETSAIGRAIANMGIQGGHHRPSREEMESVKASEEAIEEAKLNLDGFIKIAEEAAANGSEIEARIIKRAREVSREASDLNTMNKAIKTLGKLLDLEGVPS